METQKDRGTTTGELLKLISEQYADMKRGTLVWPERNVVLSLDAIARYKRGGTESWGELIDQDGKIRLDG